MKTNNKKFDIDESLGYAIARLHWGLKIRFTRHVHDILPDLTPERLLVLCRLWDRDRRPQTELAGCSCKDMGNITRIVDGLENTGFVTREADPDDRRKRLVTLTERGREVEGIVYESSLMWREEFFGALDDEEYQELFRLVRKLGKEAERIAKEEKGCDC